jgi:integrase
MTDAGGLFLFVTPSGGKLWRWKYRFGGKEKLMGLGRYPDVSLAQARERHSMARKVHAQGVDPMAQRKAEKTAEKTAKENSFNSISKLWHDHWREGKSLRHVGYVRRRLDADILPCFGARPIEDIEAPELVAMVMAIEARGAHDIAKRALETTGQIFRYAIAHGYARRNPASEIKPRDLLKPTQTVNYARVNARELPTLLKRIEVYRGKPTTRLGMKLMALTFLRTTELIGARWSEFDFENARWDVPKERMKRKRPHIVPLSKQALEVLGLLKELNGDRELVFPGERDPKKTLSNNTFLKALERMGYKGEMTGHGFRGVASTILHEQGYQHEHIELQLAHIQKNATSAAYDHALYLGPRTKMMQDWANYLEHALRKNNVVQLSSPAH